MRPHLLPILTLALLIAFGVPALAHDDPDGELATLNARIASEPDSAALHLERAELQRFRRDWASGLADLQTASRLDPSMAEVDLATASLLLDAGNLPGAHDAADRFLARRPRHVGGHLVKGRVLLRSGAKLDGAAEITRAVEIDRTRHDGASSIQPDDYLDRARALAESGRTGEAVAGLDEGLAALGSPISLALLAIELDASRGEVDAALARVATIEAGANRKEAWMARRGDLLAAAGRPAEAARAYEAALHAIAALPARARDNAATVDLEASVRARLAAIADAPAAGEGEVR